MIAARRRHLAFTVHAIDEAGSVCGARPRGRWVVSERVPVNCPRCLARLARARYVVCEVPTASADSPVHIRQVGPAGVHFGGNPDASRTLCGQIVGWDNEVVVGPLEEAVDGLRWKVCPRCKRLATAPHLRALA